MELTAQVVNEAPSSVFYVPDFISEEDENDIIREVYAAPKPKWTCLSNRRLQNWGGVPHPKGMIAEAIPKWLQRFLDKTMSIGAFPADKPPNHVLVNEYLPGQGIMPHLDGPLFFPTICNITCGSHTVLNIQEANAAEPTMKLFLERRSLVVLKEDMYHKYQHGIEEIKSDVIDDKIRNLKQMKNSEVNEGQTIERGTRISLTIRHVPSTTKFKLKLSR